MQKETPVYFSLFVFFAMTVASVIVYALGGPPWFVYVWFLTWLFSMVILCLSF